MPESPIDRIEKLRTREERLNKRIEKLTDDLANNKLRLRDVRKQIRASERLAKAVKEKKPVVRK
jgi:predicted  nucleic acid-binding Zn-ribbon protein